MAEPVRGRLRPASSYGLTSPDPVTQPSQATRAPALKTTPARPPDQKQPPNLRRWIEA